MSFEIEKSTILPQQPDIDNPDDIKRFNREFLKFIDDFQRLLKDDLTAINVELADHETRIDSLETP